MEHLYSRWHNHLRTFLDAGFTLKNIGEGTRVKNPKTKKSIIIQTFAYYRCIDSDYYIVETGDKTRKHLKISDIITDLS